MWSFVKNQRKKQGLWIVLDQNTREIVGLYIETAKKKWRPSSGNLYLLSIDQYGSVKSYAVLKTINTGGFIIIPVPLCLTC
ncbi:hypothetical protein QUA57_03710, partial [Microcoleus sp. Pol7_B2]